jgi:hypothetical protein
VTRNPAKLHEPGLPSGCHAEIPQLATDSYAVTPPGIERARSTGQTAKRAARRGQVAGTRHEDPALEPHEDAPDGSSGPMATLATLVLRQALAALDKGRLDQVRQILEHAIEAERATGDAAQRGLGGDR